MTNDGWNDDRMSELFKEVLHLRSLNTKLIKALRAIDEAIRRRRVGIPKMTDAAAFSLGVALDELDGIAARVLREVIKP